MGYNSVGDDRGFSCRWLQNLWNPAKFRDNSNL